MMHQYCINPILEMFVPLKIGSENDITKTENYFNFEVKFKGENEICEK